MSSSELQAQLTPHCSHQSMTGMAQEAVIDSRRKIRMRGIFRNYPMVKSKETIAMKSSKCFVSLVPRTDCHSTLCKVIKRYGGKLSFIIPYRLLFLQNMFFPR